MNPPAFGYVVDVMEKATFAGGCFWGVEHLFNEIPGVVDAVSGYTGGDRDNPTYEQVCSGRTGHAEAVEVTYDPAKVTYDELLNAFWNMHDPTTLNRPIVHEVVPAPRFWPAEASHPRYFDKHPGHASCHWVRGWVPTEAASSA